MVWTKIEYKTYIDGSISGASNSITWFPNERNSPRINTFNRIWKICSIFVCLKNVFISKTWKFVHKQSCNVIFSWFFRSVLKYSAEKWCVIYKMKFKLIKQMCVKHCIKTGLDFDRTDWNCSSFNVCTWRAHTVLFWMY